MENYKKKIITNLDKVGNKDVSVSTFYQTWHS